MGENKISTGRKAFDVIADEAKKVISEIEYGYKVRDTNAAVSYLVEWMLSRKSILKKALREILTKLFRYMITDIRRNMNRDVRKRILEHEKNKRRMPPDPLGGIDIVRSRTQQGYISVLSGIRLPDGRMLKHALGRELDVIIKKLSDQERGVKRNRIFYKKLRNRTPLDAKVCDHVSDDEGDSLYIEACEECGEIE